MTIFHFCIANAKSKIIFEYSSRPHNLNSILSKILKQISDKNVIRTFKDPQFNIIVKALDLISLACITTAEYPIEKSILFIGEIEDFYNSNKRIEDLENFTAEKMEFYNSPEFLTKNQQIILNLQETKGVVLDNLSKIMERENKINEIAKKTERMAQQGFNEGDSFKQQMIQKRKNDEEIGKNEVFYKKRKGWAIIASVLITIIIIFFILTFVCGDFEFSECT